MNTATGKRVLALIRGGDYAHPGEVAANELVFSGVPPDARRRILDAGCGGAGTASWVQSRGLGAVTGIEIDDVTVQLARARHPEVTIVEGDLQRATEIVPGPFDLVYSMTAIYAAPDQAAVFGELGALAAPGAGLRLLEYSDPAGRFAEMTSGDPSWGWWRPLAPRDLPELLAAAGWTTLRVRDLHQEFVHWYGGLCSRITRKRSEIVREFGRGWYDFVASEYAGILRLVQERALGGVLVTAGASH